MSCGQEHPSASSASPTAQHQDLQFERVLPALTDQTTLSQIGARSIKPRILRIPRSGFRSLDSSDSWTTWIRCWKRKNPVWGRSRKLPLAALVLRWVLGSLCHGLRLFPPNLLAGPGNQFLTDLDTKAFPFVTSLLGRGVHPQSGKCPSDCPLLVGGPDGFRIG